MPLEQKTILVNVAIAFEPDGKVKVIEAVHQDVVMRDGTVVTAGSHSSQTYLNENDQLAGIVRPLVDAIAVLKAEQDAKIAAHEEATRAAEAASAALKRAAQEAEDEAVRMRGVADEAKAAAEAAAAKIG